MTGSLEAVLASSPPQDMIADRIRAIHHDLLAQSRFIREANFRSIHPNDLQFLFGAYDERFFGGLCRRSLEGRRLGFRLSPRMTKAGGTTTRYRTSSGQVSFEIAIASSMLFDAFRDDDREVTVCGLACSNRLEALQRIFEHEMIHLGEHLCWGGSDCARQRFQEIASRHFLHRAHTHDLITRRERAARTGIRVGSRVAFNFEGQRWTGRVNRITKRATVLVEHPEGQLFSDGLRYKTFYVPVQSLDPL